MRRTRERTVSALPRNHLQRYELSRRPLALHSPFINRSHKTRRCYAGKQSTQTHIFYTFLPRSQRKHHLSQHPLNPPPNMLSAAGCKTTLIELHSFRFGKSHLNLVWHHFCSSNWVQQAPAVQRAATKTSPQTGRG